MTTTTKSPAQKKLDAMLASFEQAGGSVEWDGPVLTVRIKGCTAECNHNDVTWDNEGDAGYDRKKGSWAGRYAAFQARCQSAFEETYPGITELMETAQQAYDDCF